MKQGLFLVYISSLFLSAVTAIIYRRYLTRWKLTIMAYYLPVVFIMEIFLSWWLHDLGKSTAPFYNIYRPASVIVFGFIYYSIPFMTRFRKVIIGITLVYLAIVIIAYLFIDSVFTSNNIYLTLARGSCITFFCVFFLIAFLQLDKREEEKFWQPLVWITVGALLFYPVVSISIGFQSYLYDYNATILNHKLYQAIPQLMSIFMYSCFSYAFYLCKKKS